MGPIFALTTHLDAQFWQIAKHVITHVLLLDEPVLDRDVAFVARKYNGDLLVGGGGHMTFARHLFG